MVKQDNGSMYAMAEGKMWKGKKMAYPNARGKSQKTPVTKLNYKSCIYPLTIARRDS